MTTKKNNESEAYERLSGSPFTKAQTQVIGKVISSILKNKKVITEKDVLTEAKKSTSPLHKMIPWNDKVAADKYRKEIAKKMITYVVIVKKKPRTKTIIRIALATRKKVNGTYCWMATNDSVKKEKKQTKAQRLKASALSLSSWLHLYGDLPEFKSVASAAEKALKKIEF